MNQKYLIIKFTRCNHWMIFLIVSINFSPCLGFSNWSFMISFSGFYFFVTFKTEMTTFSCFPPKFFIEVIPFKIKPVNIRTFVDIKLINTQLLFVYGSSWTITWISCTTSEFYFFIFNALDWNKILQSLLYSYFPVLFVGSRFRACYFWSSLSYY